MPNAPKAAAPGGTGSAAASTATDKPATGTATLTRSFNGTASQSQVGAQQALEYWQQLQQAVNQLGTELKGAAEPNVVGRDTVLLRSFFDQIVGRTMQIAHAYKITWAPPQNVARR